MRFNDNNREALRTRPCCGRLGDPVELVKRTSRCRQECLAIACCVVSMERAAQAQRTLVQWCPMKDTVSVQGFLLGVDDDLPAMTTRRFGCSLFFPNILPLNAYAPAHSLSPTRPPLLRRIICPPVSATAAAARQARLAHRRHQQLPVSGVCGVPGFGCNGVGLCVPHHWRLGEYAKPGVARTSEDPIDMCEMVGLRSSRPPPASAAARRCFGSLCQVFPLFLLWGGHDYCVLVFSFNQVAIDAFFLACIHNNKS